jgi:hypothetical protein
MVGEDYRARCA